MVIQMETEESTGLNEASGEARNIKVRVSFDLPFCLFVKDGGYEIQMPSYRAMVNTKVTKHTNIDPRLFIEKVDNLELREDRHGRIRYTSLEITISGQSVIEKEIRRQVKEGHLTPDTSGLVNVRLESSDELIESYTKAAFGESIDVTNYFIAVYREMTNSYYIQTVSLDDIYQATINWFENEELLGGCLHVNYGKGGMTLEPSLSPEATQRFKDRLMVNTRTSLIKELWMNAKDYLHLGNYRMAVIESRTCVEVLVDQILLEYFTREDKTIEELKEILEVKPDTGCEVAEDILEVAKINVKLKKGLKQAIDRSLAENNSLWLEWLKAKKNRESAVLSFPICPSSPLQIRQ